MPHDGTRGADLKRARHPDGRAPGKTHTHTTAWACAGVRLPVCALFARLLRMRVHAGGRSWRRVVRFLRRDDPQIRAAAAVTPHSFEKHRKHSPPRPQFGVPIPLSLDDRCPSSQSSDRASHSSVRVTARCSHGPRARQRSASQHVASRRTVGCCNALRCTCNVAPQLGQPRPAPPHHLPPPLPPRVEARARRRKPARHRAPMRRRRRGVPRARIGGAVGGADGMGRRVRAARDGALLPEVRAASPQRTQQYVACTVSLRMARCRRNGLQRVARWVRDAAGGVRGTEAAEAWHGSANAVAAGAAALAKVRCIGVHEVALYECHDVPVRCAVSQRVPCTAPGLGPPLPHRRRDWWRRALAQDGVAVFKRQFCAYEMAELYRCLKSSAAHCSVDQRSAAQRSSAVQRSAVPCSAAQCSAAQCSTR